MPLPFMLHIVIATGNAHKFHELIKLFPVSNIGWHSLKEFPRLRSVKEDQPTFDGNAVKKAKAIARATHMPALADDSGLSVRALKGAPGIRSARFAGRHGNDAANNRKLIRLMAGVPKAKRGARYRCSLALAGTSGLIALTRGVWVGRIASAPKGRGGFGYDPVVEIPRLGKTVAQLPKKTKCRLSHRAVAARRMLPHLMRLVHRHCC